MKNNSQSEYESSVNMRVAESQIQWERFNAMLVINTIFIGLIGFTYSKEFEVPLAIQFLLAPAGIFLCLLWLQVTKRGFMWTKFWTEKAREIEEKYSETSIRPFMEGKKHKDANQAMLNTEASSSLIIKMFIAIYLLIFFSQVTLYVCVPLTNCFSKP